MENSALMRKARESLEGKWGLAIGTYLVYMILTGLPGSVAGVGSIATLVIGGPFALGSALFSLSLVRGRETKMEQIFQGFNRFSVALEAYLIVLLYVVLWMLLLIVPGIIAALSYSMTFYILADDPSLKASDALKKSKTMMDGNKLKLFYLCLRFLGLSILCILTLGIGFLWLIPYANVTMALFYEDLKKN